MTTLPRTQTDAVLDYLKKVGPITQRDAIDAIGCYRLGARIFDLKQLGHAIRTEFVKVPTRHGTTQVARYSLLREAKK